LEYFSFLEVRGWNLDPGKAIKFLLVCDSEKRNELSINRICLVISWHDMRVGFLYGYFVVVEGLLIF